MKIDEKISYCRKKAGLSQEALAEKLGVSRQAISKWETGEAAPEISKLVLIAKIFDVSTDWLLSEDEVESSSSQEVYEASWIDSLPGMIGRLFRRYGWLAGIYLALVGGVFIGIGGLGRYLVGMMFNQNFSDGFTENGFGFNGLVGDFDPHISGTIGLIDKTNPVSVLATVIIIVGCVLLLAGITLAIVLKKKSAE